MNLWKWGYTYESFYRLLKYEFSGTKLSEILELKIYITGLTQTMPPVLGIILRYLLSEYNFEKANTVSQS